jgi:DNA (cytosine-5)-methyltransferase 1
MKVVSLFSGVGGLDLGFTMAGHEIVWAIDNWEDAVRTYRMNFSSPIELGDIRDFPSVLIPRGDVVIGGFPCQGFSVANIQRRVDDSRNLLYREFVRVVRDTRPRFFVAENVKGILSLGGGAVFEKIVGDFEALGYRVRHAVLNAADYGVPQRRERVFIVGSLEGLARIWSPPAPTHADPRVDNAPGLAKWVSSGEALASIPEPEEPHNLENHDYTRYKLRFNGYLGHRVTDPSLPSPTITARGDDRGGVVIHHHPGNHRRLSARETATLQSFPLDFRFYGTKTSVYRQVANAVPPLLAREVAASLIVAELPSVDAA